MKIINLSLVALVFGLLSGCEINNIPTYDEQVKSSWSEVENQYQRRSDLIPNLVSITKQVVNHEKDTLLAIAEVRSNVNNFSKSGLLDNKQKMGEYQQLQAKLGAGMQNIMLQIENYPNLQANQNFLQLSSQLEGTENRIAIARREFIKSIEIYNTELKTFPGKIYHQSIYQDYVLRDDNVYFRANNIENSKINL